MSNPRQDLIDHANRAADRARETLDQIMIKMGNPNVGMFYTLANYGDAALKASAVELFWTRVIKEVEADADLTRLFDRTLSEVIDSACESGFSTNQMQNLATKAYASVRAGAVGDLQYFAKEEQKNQQN